VCRRALLGGSMKTQQTQHSGTPAAGPAVRFCRVRPTHTSRKAAMLRSLLGECGGISPLGCGSYMKALWLRRLPAATFRCDAVRGALSAEWHAARRAPRTRARVAERSRARPQSSWAHRPREMRVLVRMTRQASSLRAPAGVAAGGCGLVPQLLLARRKTLQQERCRQSAAPTFLMVTPVFVHDAARDALA
jgi:hypothetical protein